MTVRARVKFKENDRVGVLGPIVGVARQYTGRYGTVLQVWPNSGRRGTQYHVLVDEIGAVVFDEDQLELDVLWQLAKVMS